MQAVSNKIVESDLMLDEISRLFRAQTELDNRVTKSIYPDLLEDFCQWLDVDPSDWIKIVVEGASPNTYDDSNDQVELQQGSQYPLSEQQKVAILKSVAKEAANNSCLVIDETVCTNWGLVFSPVSAVDKDCDSLKNCAAGRLINDLSYPRGNSVNDRTDKSKRGSVQYGGHKTLCIMLLQRRRSTVLMMSVDISNAFRRVAICGSALKYNCFRIPGTSWVVIDFCSEFGWVESPMYFNIGCKLVIAILQALYGEKLGASFWVDDGNFICDCGFGEAIQMECAIIMVVRLVFGLDGDNKKKTQSWCRGMETMGLCYDLDLGVVTVPKRKLGKLVGKMKDLVDRGEMTRRILDSLVGSGRHVGACYRGIRPFWNLLVYHQKQMKRGYRARKVPVALEESLKVLIGILQRPEMNMGVPIEFVAGTAKGDIDLHMDASDVGLCVVWLERKEYVQFMFPRAIVCKIKEDKLWWTINCREFLSVLVGSLVWGSEWRGQQVRSWIDNTSAVAWVNKLEIANDGKARSVARRLVEEEVRNGFWSMAMHIPGEQNDLADAGSRDTEERNRQFDKLRRSLNLVRRETPVSVRELVNSWVE